MCYVYLTSFLALRRIVPVRSYLTESTSTQLVTSFITSRLDYCNALLVDLPLTESGRLQRIQNNAARLMTRKSKRTRITPVLQHLHWLPIYARVEYKIATLAYRHFDGTLPPYLSSTLNTSTLLIIHPEHLPAFPFSQTE